jgi:taurine dioxygenase
MTDSKISSTTEWQTTRLAGALGAEVRGVDLADPTPADIDGVKALLLEHHVLFFPDQGLDVDQHVALGRHFGELEGHPHLKNPITEHPELFELVASGGGVADEWHTDITFRPDPALMSILNMVKCPEVGGDTLWTNLHAAYDELSAPMQELCEGLTALHDALPHNRPDQMTIHPVVRIHPETGRKLLYVNEHFTRRIVEMNASESEMLLSYLTRWVQNPRFTVRYRWTEGTIGMWDNRCTQHFVMDDFDEERIIQRVTVMGDEPKGAQPPRWEPYIKSGAPGAAGRHDRQIKAYLEREAAAS